MVMITGTLDLTWGGRDYNSGRKRLMDWPSSMFDEILQYSQRGYSNIQGPIPVARRLENGLDGVSYQKNRDWTYTSLAATARHRVI